jgi:hypothetical protein
VATPVIPPGLNAIGTERGTGVRTGPSLKISRICRTRAQASRLMGRSHDAMRSMRRAASCGVERFSLPRADSSSRIILRCTLVFGAPSEALSRLIASMPSASMSTLVAVLSENTTM